MTEPHSTAVSGIPPAIGGAIGFTLLGASSEHLLLGLGSAVLVSILLDAIDKPLKAFAGVMLGSLIAGFGSPAATVLLANMVGALKGAPLLSYVVAIAIGGIIPPLVPSGFAWIKRQLGGSAK